MLERAITLHQQGKLKEASEIYEEILKQSPRHIDALHFFGLMHAEVHQWDMARELIERALKAVSYTHLTLPTKRIV